MNERAEWARLCAKTSDARRLAETLLKSAGRRWRGMDRTSS